MPDTDRAAVLERAIEVCLSGDFSNLPDLFTDDVVAWSPTIFVTSRDELAAAMAGQDTAFSDIDVSIDSLDIVGNKGFVEFRVSAKFTGQFDAGMATIDPTGDVVVVGAALVAEFENDRISAFRNYYDELSLVMQMLVE
jgi:ketosteroid isomerase-like protein